MPGVLPYEERPYRPCVGIVLLNGEGLVFVGQRLDGQKSTEDIAWQMPQGGIDKGETPLDAAMREMNEEIGTNKAEYIGEHEDWLQYDIPPELADVLWQKQFKGQKQKWLIFHFIGKDSDINIATPEPEFCAWRWASLEELPSLAIGFKRTVYEKVLGTIKSVRGQI